MNSFTKRSSRDENVAALVLEYRGDKPELSGERLPVPSGLTLDALRSHIADELDVPVAWVDATEWAVCDA